MTSTAALLISVILMINELSIRSGSEVGDLASTKYWESNLVYLISNCLLLKKICILPFKKNFHPISFLFFEISITLIILEYSAYSWKKMQQFIHSHAKEIMNIMGRNRCEQIITSLTLKFLSFISLVLAVSVFDFNKVYRR